MKYLFLCAMGQNRSPTAARVARELAKERGIKLKVFYAGIDFLVNSPSCFVTDDLIEHFRGYDRIFVMEKYMEEGLEKIIGKSPKIVCLYIPDEYVRDDTELVKILRNNLGIFI